VTILNKTKKTIHFARDIGQLRLQPLGHAGALALSLRIFLAISLDGQAVLGHHKLDTTARYTRVATSRIAAIKSPIGEIEVPHLKKKARQKR